MRLKLLFWLILLMVGCGNGPTHLSAQQAIPNDTLITLQRSTCFGTCPDYKVTISADGKVTFEGREFVKTKGTVHGSITLEGLRQLVAEFDKARYFSLRDKYETEKDGCPEYWTDHPSAVTSIRIDGKSKSISHYQGCRDDKGAYPKALTELEDRIDQIVGTKQWIN
jgi:hypothetical protein